MAEGRINEAWDRAAVDLAVHANFHRDPKRRPRPFTAEEFHPLAHRRRHRRPVPDATVNVRDLRSILFDRPAPRPPRPPGGG